MKIINDKEKDFAQKLEKIIQQNQAEIEDNNLATKVADIIFDVKKNGDDALIKIANKFDGANFKKAADLLVPLQEIKDAKNKINKDLLAALTLSKKRIYEYHLHQKPKDFFYKDEIGIGLGNIWKAIEKIGIYAPGGAALYPSSILMSAVPALVAGVKNIILTTPAQNGKIAPVILAAANLCGIKTIYKIGGASAIAALALGTKTISAVDKIVGPGNNFVAIAKKQLFGRVGIDMIAGPTDILIIANRQNNCDFVAADMLAQLEHGASSKALLITDDATFANDVNAAILQLAKSLPRQNIIKESLKNSAIIIVENLATKATNHLARENFWSHSFLRQSADHLGRFKCCQFSTKP